MRPVYLGKFNDLNWMNIGLNKKIDYHMADYLGETYDKRPGGVWDIVFKIQLIMSIEPTENHQDFWEHSMSRLEFYQEVGITDEE